jgi:hypothetical protein
VSSLRPTGVAMPKRSSQTDKPSPSTSAAGPSATAQKTAATVLRHKEERRAESLRQIQTQTDEGTLVIRHMSDDERAAASQAARQTRSRNEARTRRYKSPDDH